MRRYLVLAFLIILNSGSLADESKVPTWKKALPGTRAYLSDNGGGANTATVCDTADRYRDWLKFESAPGCQAFQHGLKVVIEVVLLDSVRDTAGAMWLPLVKIKIPSRNFTGYYQLLGLHPEVPAGTVVHFSDAEKGQLKLYQTAGMHDEGSVELGSNVTATVLSYDPTDIDKLELYVSINDGPHKGMKGRMLSFLETISDGQPMNQFDQAVIENKVR
jgi:hypothetical protein